jgi:hypothetical protein
MPETVDKAVVALSGRPRTVQFKDVSMVDFVKGIGKWSRCSSLGNSGSLGLLRSGLPCRRPRWPLVTCARPSASHLALSPPHRSGERDSTYMHEPLIALWRTLSIVIPRGLLAPPVRAFRTCR